jgi:ATP-dependent RNA helicase DDX10/DBP4
VELAHPDEDGYISPGFELPSEGDEEDMPPPLKRSKHSTSFKDNSKGLEDEEELALRLLRNRR